MKQDGLLSPNMYNVYIDGLVLYMTSNLLGCHMGRSYMGVLMYANDIVFPAPSVQGLQEMLNHYACFALRRDIKLNV